MHHLGRSVFEVRHIIYSPSAIIIVHVVVFVATEVLLKPSTSGEMIEVQRSILSAVVKRGGVTLISKDSPESIELIGLKF